MLSRLGQYISDTYKLKCDYNVDLIIHSPNVLDTILVTAIENNIYIKFNDVKLETTYKNMYKDIRFVLDNLTYVYYLDGRGDIIASNYYYDFSERPLIDEIEDYIWDNRQSLEAEKIMVMTFALNYSFEAKVSGSFVDTFNLVFDKTRYEVMNNAIKKFHYKGNSDYLVLNKSLMGNVIMNEANVKELKKYFLSLGYAFLIDYHDEKEDVYQVIDIDFDSFKNIAGDRYMVMSALYDSIIYYENGQIYLRGKVLDKYKNVFKIVQVDNEPCNYVHNIKTSRLSYNGKIYEATGKTISDELNSLGNLLDNKLMCCFNCRYGNYIDDENNIYCLKDFKPHNLSDVVYIVDEAKLIPYDPFNLCEDFMYQSDDYYTSTKCKLKRKIN
ncbi:MAG: hypothetical protein ACI35W_06920 [Anaeroplasmataceae bacterium]